MNHCPLVTSLKNDPPISIYMVKKRINCSKITKVNTESGDENNTMV